MGLTHVHDVCKHPLLDEYDDDTADQGSDQLCDEHKARRNLHVVTKLQVSSESNRLVCASISNALEDHDSDRFAWKQVAGDEFVYNS